MKKLYSLIIENIAPDTIMSYNGGSLRAFDKTLTAIEPEDFNLISNVYPNPVIDIVTIDLQQKGMATFKLNDAHGKLVLEGNLNDMSNKIDLSNLKAGVYIMTLTNSIDKEMETVKIVKS